jgi:aspartate/methionine/tyrosine aminotransferase
MTDFSTLDKQQLAAARKPLMERYREFKSRDMNLDMTRGKPCPEQLDLAMPLLSEALLKDFRSENGIDCRNYGGLDGIPEAKRLFADYMGVAPEELIIGGNSSLNLMHDTVMRALVYGASPGETPWGQLAAVKFLCPSPGYDRHFFICEHLGVEMITIPMNAEGPEMQMVEELAAADVGVKGIWCVPKYSNPSGVVYSDEVVERLASMPTKAPDFRIFWDNAYAVHDLTDSPPELKNILDACRKAGHPDRPFLFGSTSKVTLAGSGLAMMAASAENIGRIKRHMSIQTIGPDKLNQLRHVKFLESMAGVRDHMRKHAAILKPKFEAVQEGLAVELEGKNIAQWSRPSGGYFVSIDTLRGCASRVVRMASEAGVKLTPAGATYPYGKDPADSNIRIAPSYPPLGDIQSAMELVAICIQMVSIDRLLAA